MQGEPPASSKQANSGGASQIVPNVFETINQSAELEGITTSSKRLAQQEADHKFRDKERGESLRRHIHIVMICGIYAIGFILLILVLVRAWHFIAPGYLKWLDEQQNHEIERIIFSGLILSLATKYFKHYHLFERD